MSDIETDVETDEQAKELVLEYELDAPPEKVWRALSMPAFRERWLPGGDLADPEPVASTPGEEIGYRMRDNEPPFLESIVTFRIAPDADGGTILRIVHGPVDTRLMQRPPLMAMNDNRPRLMCAA